ncbi:unnamed protein product [Caenorhabditis auriculariae]|uniref:Uncharacterized protein n=1 Tax=Caenorhabditis auriculariae TaxID=2777116 RepID=A0A8S1HD51_9PELO|nr:unnamed protein product [Caenorhabditis auriculariae]
MSASFVELAGADSIETAALKVANHIESTIDNSDIYEKLTQNGTTPLSGLGDKFYSKGAPEFMINRRVPIPGELQMQMNNVHSQFSMGFFTAINRVWVVIDNNLYMWNYETNDDLAFFDSSETTIIKVSLVTMKPNVFDPCVTYGLVIGTITDISLYPVVESEDPMAPQLAIDPTHFFKINLEGAAIGDIACTNLGRIFYTAGNQLYEFVYERQTGWFGSGHKCRSVKQSATLLGTLIQLPFFSSAKEDLDQITLDKSRNILYCLGKSGSILVFDLGENGDECRKVCSVSSGQIAHESHLLTQFGHDESTFKNITSICALEASQSSQFNLVAVTVKGVRFGNRCLTQYEVRPQCLRVAHVRFSPGITPTSIYGNAPNGVTVAFVNETICAMATANRNTVWGLSNYFYPAARIFCESMTEMNVPGHVWEIALLTGSKVDISTGRNGTVDRVKPHAYYRQQIEGKTRLLICSNEGVFEFDQVGAVDAFRDALYESGVEGKPTLKLWQKLGSTEMLILSLRVLTSDSPLDERIKLKAEQILHSLKDAPELVDERSVLETSTWSPVEGDFADWKQKIKSPLLSSTPRGETSYANGYMSPFSPSLNISVTGGDPTSMRMLPSRRHDALYYYFSRLVMPIWNYPLCKVVAGKQLEMTFDIGAVQLLAEEIRKLGQIVDDFRLVPSVECNGYPSTTDRLNAEASSLERLSLIGLRKLIEATVETLSLWLLAKNFNLAAISSGMDPSVLPTFAARKTSQIVAENQNLNGELIRAMIKFFLGDEAGTSMLSESLRSLCPTLYSVDDACVTNGMEQLESAKRAGPGATRRKLVATAVNMFKQSITKVALAKTCQQLAEKVGAYEEVVDLCLLRARRDDAKQLATLAFKQGKCGEDPEIRSAELKRSECYKVITDELDRLEQSAAQIGDVSNEHVLNRDVMINAVLGSDDELAHFAIFRWLLEKRKANIVLESKSPYIEAFLCNEINSGRGQKYFDLLWKFYEKSGNYEKAARLLSKLAENDNFDIPLVQRCSYLSHAIMCAQASKDPNITASIEDLRDRLDIANIQTTIRDALDAPRYEEVSKKLDGPIMPLQDLLVQYVMPYKLYKIKLAIFHCANMYIEEHIFATWDSIIQEVFEAASDEVTLCENLLSTIYELYSIYRETRYFPKVVIIQKILEVGAGGVMHGSNRHYLPVKFFSALSKRIEISNVALLELFSNIFRGDAWWTQNEKGQFYLTQIVHHLSRCVLAELDKLSVAKRKVVANECNAQIMPFIRRACDVSSSQRLQNVGEELTTVQLRFSSFL